MIDKLEIERELEKIHFRDKYIYLGVLKGAAFLIYAGIVLIIFGIASPLDLICRVIFILLGIIIIFAVIYISRKNR